MKKIGYLLLVAGFLAAAYATALDVQLTAWTKFVPAVLAAAAGVIMVKRADSGEARSEHVLTANRSELRESLGNIVRQLQTLNEQQDDLETGDIRLRVDELLRDDLRRFADARESMVHLFGLQTYANIMSEFAAGERYVNRVWSASADGYRTEAATYLQKASAQFADALRQLEAAEAT